MPKRGRKSSFVWKFVCEFHKKRNLHPSTNSCGPHQPRSEFAWLVKESHTTDSFTRGSTRTRMAKLCQVCTTAEAKYKCPGCRAPYCSAACYKAHKETPCAPAAVTASATTAPVTTSNGQPSVSANSSQQPSLSAHKNQDHEELIVDAAQLLSTEQLDELRTLPIVHKSMENPAIRELLTKVWIRSVRCVTSIWMDGTFGSWCGFPFCCMGLMTFCRVVLDFADRHERQSPQGAREGAAQPRVREFHVPVAGRSRCESDIE